MCQQEPIQNDIAMHTCSVRLWRRMLNMMRLLESRRSLSNSLLGCGNNLQVVRTSIKFPLLKYYVLLLHSRPFLWEFFVLCPVV